MNRARSCNLTGTFASGDGTDTRVGVGSGDGRDVQEVGDRTLARDTGGSVVYPADGGDDWIYGSLAPLIAAVVLFSWARSVPLPALRARAARARMRAAGGA